MYLLTSTSCRYICMCLFGLLSLLVQKAGGICVHVFVLWHVLYTVKKGHSLAKHLYTVRHGACSRQKQSGDLVKWCVPVVSLKVQKNTWKMWQLPKFGTSFHHAQCDISRLTVGKRFVVAEIPVDKLIKWRGEMNEKLQVPTAMFYLDSFCQFGAHHLKKVSISPEMRSVNTYNSVYTQSNGWKWHENPSKCL